MRSPALLLLVLAAAVSCSDEDKIPTQPGAGVMALGGVSPSHDYATNDEVTLFWRTPPVSGASSAELYAYRNQTEFGLNTHMLWHFQFNRDLGNKLIRHTIYWDEPIQDALNHLQAAVDSAPDGSTLLIIVHSQAICVSPANNEADRTAKFQDYANYVSTLAAAAPRTGRVRVLYWQILNEANAGWTNILGLNAGNGNDGHCNGDGAGPYVAGWRYASLLSYVHPAIKAATNGEAFVVMTGFAGVNVVDFFNGMYDNNAGRYYDIAAIQPYGPDEALGSQFTSLLESRGEGTRPLFATEFGSSMPDEAAQQAYWLGFISYARKTRMYNKVFGYVICGGATDPLERNASLRRTYGDPGPNECSEEKPIYTYLKQNDYNYWLNVDSLRNTDVVVRGTGWVPTGYSYVNEGDKIRVQNVPVNFRSPTRIQFVRNYDNASRLDVDYRVYVNNNEGSSDPWNRSKAGWSSWGSDSTAIGTWGQALSMNAIQLKLRNKLPEEHVQYSVYQNGAWGPWVSDGAVAGDTSRKAEAFRAQVYRSDALGPNITICYYAHVTVMGWLTAYPRCDGAYTGWSLGSTYRMEAIRIWIKRTGAPPMNGSVTLDGPTAIKAQPCIWYAYPSFEADTYHWFLNGNDQGATSSYSFSFTPSSSFELSVQATDSYGHFASATKTVSVDGSNPNCDWY